MSKPYISDPNGQKMYDGCRVWIYSEEDEVTLVYGTLKLNPIDNIIKWSVVWDNLGELFWPELKPLFMGDNTDSNNKEEPDTNNGSSVTN